MRERRPFGHVECMLKQVYEQARCFKTPLSTLTSVIHSFRQTAGTCISLAVPHYPLDTHGRPPLTPASASSPTKRCDDTEATESIVGIVIATAGERLSKREYFAICCGQPHMSLDK